MDVIMFPVIRPLKHHFCNTYDFTVDWTFPQWVLETLQIQYRSETGGSTGLALFRSDKNRMKWAEKCGQAATSALTVWRHETFCHLCAACKKILFLQRMLAPLCASRVWFLEFSHRKMVGTVQQHTTQSVKETQTVPNFTPKNKIETKKS